MATNGRTRATYSLTPFTRHRTTTSWRNGTWLGSNALARNAFFVGVSAIACLSAFNLTEFLLTHRLPMPAPLAQVERYSLPIFHLVPWLVGIRWFRRIRKRLTDGTIDAPTAHLAYTIVLELLVSVYVALSLIEGTADVRAVGRVVGQGRNRLGFVRSTSWMGGRAVEGTGLESRSGLLHRSA
jgi:hypothetical protein